MQKMIPALVLALSLSLGASMAKADAAVEPVNSVGAAMGGCALLQVTGGNFNAGGYLAIDLTQPGGPSMLGSAMLAFSLGRHIWVNRVRQAASCYGLTDYANDIRVLTY